MFWIDPSTNQRYYLGKPFVYDGVQYTAAGANATKFNTLGFNQVVVGARPDDRFYIVTGPGNDGNYTTTARDLDELKGRFVRETKTTCYNILKQTVRS